MALTITATTTIAISMMAVTTKGSFPIDLVGGGGGKVATGVPHLKQNRASSSSLAPHIRQLGNSQPQIKGYTVQNLSLIKPFVLILLNSIA
jgi:hypothetical protein